ncbi:hypothetical protein [Cellulomonas sp. URHB0016]
MQERPLAVVSYSIDGAAAATGMSADVIRRAIRAGDIIAHYPTSKPLILADELRAWVERAPTEKR